MNYVREKTWDSNTPVRKRGGNGKRYGFVRFKHVNDVEGLLGRLQKTKIGDEPLRVKTVGRSVGYGMTEGLDNRDNRRFVDVINEGNKKSKEKANYNNATGKVSHKDFDVGKDWLWVQTGQKELLGWRRRYQQRVDSKECGREVKARCFLAELLVLCEERGLIVLLD
ncbi:transposon TX1 [Tanacetum coccineum]|uniref:Transposon TX1 n=1 Tax=Tanacetum coccineum TaxID=301880 RepID=A0ABQ4YMQ3_9ASTR